MLLDAKRSDMQEHFNEIRIIEEELE